MVSDTASDRLPLGTRHVRDPCEPHPRYPRRNTFRGGLSDDGACRGTDRRARRDGHEDSALDRRRARRRDVGSQRPGLQPCDRRADGRGRPRVGRGGRRRRAERQARAAGVAHDRRSRSARSSSSAIRELFDAHREDLAQAPHGRARQGALRRDGRGRARARGDRVRLRHPDAAQGRVLRAGLDRHRRLLDPPAARRRAPASRRSTSRRWCRCGCGRPRSPAATASC